MATSISSCRKRNRAPTLAELHDQVVAKRSPDKRRVAPADWEDANEGFEGWGKDDSKWVMDELPVSNAFCTLNLGRHPTKVCFAYFD